MKVHVDPNMCIGSASCVGTCPQVFEIGDAGVAVVKVNPVPANLEAAVREAVENCPVGAISAEE
jgi:ferredoxin